MSSPRAMGLSELNLRYAYLEERQTRLLRELEEIREVKKQLDAERATYAPVYLVPDDVLYQILEEAYAHNSEACNLDYRCDTPIAITHVSRRWRYLALSLPKIWACIHVPTPLSKGHLPLLNLFVIRSQPLPTSFSIRCRYYKSASPEIRLYMECLALLLKSKVRSCTICTDYVDTMETLIGYLSNADKSRFGTLRLQVMGEENSLLMDGDCLSCSLRSLSLHAVRLPSPPIALHGLRELLLEYQPISLRYLHEIAIACPELTTFTTRDITTTSHGSHLEARFPSLRHLSLLEVHFSGIRDLLCWVEAPRLETLVIRDISLGSSDAPPAPVPQYRTYPALKHISIRFPYAASHIPQFLHYTPNVVSLDLEGTNAVPLLEVMLSAEKNTFLSRLRKLTVSVAWNEQYEALFLNVARQRKEAGEGLDEMVFGHLLLAKMDNAFLQSLSRHVTITRLEARETSRSA